MDLEVKTANGEKDQDQQQLQEEYLKNIDHLEEGKLISGHVVQVDKEYVYIDVGYKSEGRISKDEFTEKLPEIGETIDVMLISRENRYGNIIVSKKEADKITFLKNLKEAFANEGKVECLISKVIKGGFEVDFGFGVNGFVPFSKMDINKIDDPELFINRKEQFIIERLYNENKLNIVLNRRKWLEKERDENREQFLKTAKIGDEVEGVVKNFSSFGAFIDLGGFDGLLHVNDMTWGHASKPRDFVKKGETLKLKVIRIEPEIGRINLSLKHFSEDPWNHFEEKYHEGDVIRGKVTKLIDFGAFIELEEGIEGLIHITELSWLSQIKHPKEVLAPGQEVEAVILDYDVPGSRVSLSAKQVLPNPWDSMGERFPIGKKITGKVIKITGAGAFIELEEGVEGFLHVDELSWTKRIRSVSSIAQEGDSIDVVVADIDKEKESIRLSVKQLVENPWKTLKKRHPIGSIVEGEITRKTDFGLFVKIDDDIEGLLYKGELAEPDDERSADELLNQYKEGDSVKVAIINIIPDERKLAFSISAIKNSEERVALMQYVSDESDEESSYTLGDLLKDREEKSDE